MINYQRIWLPFAGKMKFKKKIDETFLLQSDLNIVAAYDRRGKYVYTGNAKGRVCLHLISETLSP